jgi:hypothetical protein
LVGPSGLPDVTSRHAEEQNKFRPYLDGGLHLEGLGSTCKPGFSVFVFALSMPNSNISFFINIFKR